MLTQRTSSWSMSHTQPPSLKPAPLFTDPQPKELYCAADQGSLLDGLLQVKADLASLDHRLCRLSDSPAHIIDAKQRHEELDEPIAALEANMAADRANARIRFEDLEEHLTALEENNAALLKCCSSLKEQSISELRRDAAAAKLGYAGLSQSTAGAEPGVKRELDVDQRNVARTSNEEVEPEQRISRQRSFSPASATRRRSRSPAPRAHFDVPAEQFEGVLNYRSSSTAPLEVANERSLVSRLSAAVTSQEESSRQVDVRHGSFRKPGWACKAHLKSRPLAGGKDFYNVVAAFSRAYVSSKVPPGQPVNMGVLVTELRMLDPTIFARHGATAWSDFMPLAQRYVAFFPILTPCRNDPNRWTEEVILKNPAFYDYPVDPPSFHAQLAALRAPGVPPPTKWVPKLPAFSEMRNGEATNQSEPRSPHDDQPAPAFPDLWRPMTAEWTEYLAKPSSFFALVDTLRQIVKPNKEVEVRAVHHHVRQRMGYQLYYDILDACNGTNRFLGLAAKHIKITKAAHDDGIILFHDAAFPFYKDADNEEYTAYSSSDGILPAQRSRSRSPEPRKMRQWGKARTPT